jgi:hypothetical protein
MVEDTSAYSYDASMQETLGSVGSFQQMLLQHQHHHGYSDTDHTGTDADTDSNRGSDVSRPDNGAGATAGMQANVTAWPTFSTSLAMPGNMQQQLLAPMQSLTSSSSIYGGGYSMALALQLYQQQQQQLLLNQHHLLMSQASSETAGLQSAGSIRSSVSGASVLQTQGSSGPGSPAQSSAGQIGSAQAALLLTQSLQMQQLQGYLLQQHQQQQHAHVLQAASMLHGPSPLSVMSSGNMSSLCAANAGGLAALLQAPVSTAMTAALPAVPALEIAPLVCGDKPASTARPQAAAAAINPAASIQVSATTGPSTTGAAVLGSFQNLLTA